MRIKLRNTTDWRDGTQKDLGYKLEADLQERAFQINAKERQERKQRQIEPGPLSAMLQRQAD